MRAVLHCTVHRSRLGLAPRRGMSVRGPAGVAAERLLALALPAAMALAAPATWAGDWQWQLAAASRPTERGLIIGRERGVAQWALAWRSAEGSVAELALASQGGPLRDARLGVRVAQGLVIDDDWQAEAGLGYYGYPGQADRGHETPYDGRPAWRYGRRYDRLDLTLALRWRDLLSLAVSGQRYHAAPDGPLPWALDLGGRWPLSADGAWSLVGTLGRAEVPRWPGRHYTHGSVGLAWQQGSRGLTLARMHAGEPARALLGARARGHWTLSWAQDF